MKYTGIQRETGVRVYGDRMEPIDMFRSFLVEETSYGYTKHVVDKNTIEEVEDNERWNQNGNLDS